MSHEPLDVNGGNQLSISDNIQALWTRMDQTQQAVEDCGRHIHTLNTQLNNILQAFTGLQRSHQLLQDMVQINNQDVDEEIFTLCFQLDFLRGECLPTTTNPVATPDYNPQLPPVQTTPTLQVVTIPNPIVSTSEPNLKPAKPDMWDGTEQDAKPFQNRVLNYLESFSGTAFLKQMVFVLSLTTHTKLQSWTNTCQDWLINHSD